MKDYHTDPSYVDERAAEPARGKTRRIFIGHPKSFGDAQLGRLKSEILATFVRAAPADVRVEVTLGRDDYNAHFSACGSWDAWAADVATGVHHVSRQPRYHAIVVPAGLVGAATAKIIEQALARGKKVFEWNGERGELRRVTAITRVSESFKDGWRIEAGP